MKKLFSFLAVMVVAMGGISAQAVEEPHDTLYFYKTWSQMLNQQPDAFLEDPYIELQSPFEIYISTTDYKADKAIKKDYLAATIGDSIWLINSEYIKKNFSGNVSKLSGYIPVFFNDKVAYLTFVGYGENLSFTQMMFGTLDDPVEYEEIVDLYYIDFFNRKVLKVTPVVLSGLLEPYHDLQMRYEGMKDYKKRSIIRDYFYKFVDRATQDVMRPFILDLVN